MKKLLTALFICLSVMAVNAQKGNAIKETKDSVAVDLSKITAHCSDVYISNNKVEYRRIYVQDSTGMLMSLTKNDTLIVGAVKFLKIGDKVYNVEALKQNEIVGLRLQYWQAVIEMLRNATGVNLKPEEMIAIIQAIVQQLPKSQR